MSDEDPFVREARLSFQEEYGKKKIKFRSSVASVAPDRDRKITINIQPAWSFAKNVNTPKLQGVEIPVLESIASRKMFNYDKVYISPEDNKLRARNSFKRLLYYKTSNGKSFNIVLTYLPDVAYVKKFSGRISKGSLNMRTVKSAKYSGYIEYARLDGRGIFVLQFKEGKLIRRHTYKYKKYSELAVSNMAFKSSSSNGAVENGGTSAPMTSAMWGDTEQCEECVPIEIRVCAGELEEEEVEDEDCGEWTDSGQEECTPIECPEVDPEEPGDDCWPDCDDECYDPDSFYICEPGDPDPGNPDGPEDPWWDCAGVKFGSAYLCPDGTCIGGTTGLWQCPEIDTIEDPCANKAKLDEKFKSQIMKDRVNYLKSVSNGNEHGFTTQLSGANKDIVTHNPEFDGGYSGNITFNINITEPLTVGFNHNHPNGSAHSTRDLFFGADLYEGMSSSNKKLFLENFSSTIVTDEKIFVVTIKNADEWLSKASEINSNGPDYYNSALLDFDRDFISNGVYAPNNRVASLLMLFGDAINIYVSDVDDVNFELMSVDEINCVLEDPCN